MAPPRRPGSVIGLDVGRSSHWACVATRDGEVLASKPVANRECELDSLFAEFPGALVGVAPGQQAPEEPAHLLVQLPRPDQWPMGRVLRALPRPRHAARQGAEGRREKEAQGDLRGHERQGSVRRVGRTKEQSAPPGPARACPDFPPKSGNRVD